MPKSQSVKSKTQLPFKLFMVFLLPMLLSNFLQGLSGTLNNIYVSKLIGDQAFASVSVFFPVIFLMISIVIGLGAGGSILVGQAWGAGDYDKVKSITGSTLTLNALIGILFAMLGALFLDPLLTLLKTPIDLVSDTRNYAYVMLLNIPCIFIFICFTSLLRGTGDSVTPLLALIVSTILGVLLTPIFIIGLFGIPPLGIISPALALLCANILTIFILFIYLNKTSHILAFNSSFLKHLKLKPSLVNLIFKISIPMTVQMITIAVSELLIIRFINGYGSAATTSYGALIQIIGYVQFPAISIAITVSILGAQAIGRGHFSYLNKIMQTGLWINLFLTGGLVLLITLCATNIIQLFITDKDTVILTRYLLHISLWGMIIFGFARVFSAIMQASGVVLIPTLITIACILIVLLPVAWFFSLYFGLSGVWIAYPITFIVLLALQFCYYWFVWRHKTIVRLV